MFISYLETVSHTLTMGDSLRTGSVGVTPGPHSEPGPGVAAGLCLVTDWLATLTKSNPFSTRVLMSLSSSIKSMMAASAAWRWCVKER